MAGISSRTRSKNVPLFRSVSLGGSSKRRKSDEDDMGLDFGSCSKKMKVKKEPFVVPKGVKVIFIDEDDYGNEGEEGSVQQCDEKMFDGDVKKEEGDEENPITIHSDEYGESDEQYSISSDSEYDADVKDGVKSGGNGEFYDKDKNFVDLDESDEEKFVDSDDDDDDSDESEETETSDEDFEVDELNCISDKDDESSSGSLYDDEEEKVKKKLGRRYFNVVEKLAREAMDGGIWEMNNEEVKDKSPSSVNNDEVEHSDYGSVATSTAFDSMKGSSSNMDTSEKQKAESVENVSDGDGDVNVAKKVAKLQKTKDEEEIKVLWDELDRGLRESEVVPKNEASEEQKAKSVGNVSDVAKVKAKDNAKPNVSVKVADCYEGKEQYVKGLGVDGVSSVQAKQEKMTESHKQKMEGITKVELTFVLRRRRNLLIRMV